MQNLARIHKLQFFTKKIVHGVRRRRAGAGRAACASRVLCVRLGACWGFSANELAY